ncbi:DUF3135 domain-containing protein [Thiohalomonas denitrificans]|uniref:DUF3135 domain-containing protein n=1 Tax=Thiohalomonas denitrificans TaxID=415747 RepID=A0A1G5QWU5_9GAMM|nr:DUF3135 domain-containing protein [Thiohalomonas denitrificans]SCZ66156.1 Protein of unknown function [Thiohalomonas denitrificans]
MITPPEYEDLRALAQRDPDAFERRRREIIESALARVPEERRQRMRRLQWRIDQERLRCTNPLSACITLSRMMWDSVTGNHGLLDVLHNGKRVREDETGATVLPLNRHRMPHSEHTPAE